MTDLAEAAPAAASDQTATSQVATETSPPATETPAPATTESKPAPTIEETIKSVWDKRNPPRDPVTKRFVSPSAAPAGQPEAEASPAAEETPAPPATTEKKPEATPAIPAPLSWSGEMKAKWSSLPPEVQTYVAQRDKETHDAISRAGQQIKAFEPIGRVLHQHIETFRRNNLHPAEGVARLLAVEANLQKDPVATVKQIAEAYGVDLSALTGGAAAPSGDQQQPAEGDIASHPFVRSLQARLDDTAQKLDRVTSFLTAQQGQQEQAGRDGLARQISDFADAKDEAGTLLHPHLDRVAGQMAALMYANPSWDLQQAYDRAVRVDDELFQQSQREAEAAAEKKRLEDAAKKAAEAKKAAALNVRSEPGTGKSPKSWEDTLNEVAQKHYGRT